MKYYKLKTVAFYIFVATIMSFDLKGSENGNEVICPCCCSDEGEKKGEKEKKKIKKRKKELCSRIIIHKTMRLYTKWNRIKIF